MKNFGRCLFGSSRTLVEIFMAGILSGISAMALAQDNSIETVTTSQQGTSVIVRVTLKSPVAAPPASFAVNNPARVAFDFLKTANGVGKNTIETGQGDLRSINVVQSGDRSRIVFNLKRPVQYRATVEQNIVTITLDSQIAAATLASTSSSSRFAEAIDPGRDHSIKDIDFRRGAEAEGRVMVELSDNRTGIDIRTQGQTIVVDFSGTKLPENLRRRLNVADFGTPIQTVNTFAQGDNVRMVIEPRGNWEHNAYQSDNRLVIEVKPVKEDPNKLLQNARTGYKGEKLSLNFQNVEVRSLLQVIADFTDLNIITSDSVGGNLTLRLKDVPWDQALDIILQSKSLDMRKTGNVILVAPKDELATKEKLDLEAKAQIAELEPLRSEVFQLNYTKADSFKEIFEDAGNKRILSKRGRAVIDPRTNQIFVTDTGTKLEELRQLILRIDIPARQVLIEARIVEADDQFSRNLGVKLGFNDMRTIRGGQAGFGGDKRVVVGGNYIGVGEKSGQAELTQDSYGNTQFFSLPAAGINGVNAASVAVSLFRAGSNYFLNLELSALEADGKGKIVSSPRIVTADQVKALIEQGTELPYEVATSSGATSLAFRKANLKLEVTPQITPEGNIILDVDVNKDTVGRETRAGFAIDTKHVNTKVLVENGGTVVIGGIFQQIERSDITQVPFFGDLPVVGNLFKNTQRRNDKTELLVFITPKVISDRVNAR